MKSELFQLCDQVVTSALNSVWQGIAVAVLVGLTLRLCKQTNAATRHGVWLATLLLVCGLLPAHWIRERLAPKHSGPTRSQAAPDVLDKPRSGAFDSHRTAQESDSAPEVASSDLKSLDAEAGPIEEEPAAGGAQAAGQDAISQASDAWASTLAWVTSKARGLGQWIRSPLGWRVAVPPFGSAVLLGVWVAGTGIGMARLMRQVHRLKGWKRRSVPAGGELAATFRRVCSNLKVTRPVELRISTEQRVPVLAGFRRPMILMPAEEASRLGIREAEQILGHELGHVERRDDWVNLAQHVIEAGLFFHPAVWWISKRLALEREIASDDFALQQSGPAKGYALLLIELASRLKESRERLAPGVSANKHQLQQRIAMILNKERSASPGLSKGRLGIISLAAIIVAALGMELGPRIVLAQTAPAAPGGVTSPAAAASVSAPVQPAGATVTPVPPSTPEIQIADTREPAAPEPPDVAPGPKFKPNPDSDDAAPPAGPGPRPPRRVKVRPVNPQVRSDQSLEERLDRLERMVEKLAASQESMMALQSPKGPRSLYLNDGDKRMMAKSDEFKKQMAELSDSMKGEGQRAAEEAKRAAKEAQRAMKEAEAQRDNGPWRDVFQAQIKSLQKQRDVLQREKERLDRQIERIQDEQRRVEEKQRRAELDGDRTGQPMPLPAPQRGRSKPAPDNDGDGAKP